MLGLVLQGGHVTAARLLQAAGDDDGGDTAAQLEDLGRRPAVDDANELHEGVGGSGIAARGGQRVRQLQLGAKPVESLQLAEEPCLRGLDGVDGAPPLDARLTLRRVAAALALGPCSPRCLDRTARACVPRASTAPVTAARSTCRRPAHDHEHDEGSCHDGRPQGEADGIGTQGQGGQGGQQETDEHRGCDEATSSEGPWHAAMMGQGGQSCWAGGAWLGPVNAPREPGARAAEP